jgi:hypothetical protein
VYAATPATSTAMPIHRAHLSRNDRTDQKTGVSRQTPQTSRSASHISPMVV